jgi:hypothetical protein
LLPEDLELEPHGTYPCTFFTNRRREEDRQDLAYQKTTYFNDLCHIMNNQNFKDVVLENSGLQLIEGANGRLYINDVSLDLLVLTKKEKEGQAIYRIKRCGDMADEANTNKWHIMVDAR